MNCQEINISPLYVKIKNVMEDYYYQHNTHLLNLISNSVNAYTYQKLE